MSKKRKLFSNKPAKRFRTSITPELEQVLAENNRVKKYKIKNLASNKKIISFKLLITTFSPSQIYNHNRDKKNMFINEMNKQNRGLK